MIRVALIVIIVAVVAVLGARIVDVHPPETQAKLNTPSDSDYYLLDAIVQQMDENGKTEYRMTAAETLHYPDESARLTDIHVNYLGESSNLWTMTATRGRIPAGERDILLHDGVELLRNRNSKQNMRLTTERAWVRPDQDQVDTDALIIATAPGQQVRAVGMTLFLKQSRVVLDKDVQVTYQP